MNRTNFINHISNFHIILSQKKRSSVLTIVKIGRFLNDIFSFKAPKKRENWNNEISTT